MKPYIKKMAWEFWHENRLSLLIGMGILVCFLNIFLMHVDITTDAQAIQYSHVVFMMFIMCAVTGIISVGHYNRSTVRLGIPVTLYAKPVGVHEVVMIRQLAACTMSVMVYLAIDIIIWIKTGQAWPVVLPMVYIITLTTCLQAAIWALPAYRGIQALMGAVVIILFCSHYEQACLTWYSQADYPFGNPEGASAMDQLVYCVCLVCWNAVAWWISLYGIRLDRRGDVVNLEWISRRYFKLDHRILPKSRHYGSGFRAQWIMEWTRKGWVLCAANVVLCGIGIIWCLSKPKQPDDILGYFAALAVLNVYIFPLLIGMQMGQQNSTQEVFIPHVGIRPIRNSALLVIYLTNAVTGLILAWLTFGVMLLVLKWVLLMLGHVDVVSDLNEAVHHLVHEALNVQAGSNRFLTFLLVAWATMGLGASLMLTGRRVLIITVFLCLLFGFPLLASLIVPHGQARIDMAALIGLILLSGSLYAFIKALRMRMINPWVMIGVVAVYCFLFYTLIIHPRLLRHIFLISTWQEFVVATKFFCWFSGLLMLCMAPIATAPLALYWNRHR